MNPQTPSNRSRTVLVGEDAFVERIARALKTSGARSELRLRMGDDAALWRPRRGHDAVLTCDWFLQGTHFLLEKHPAESVGWKCLARAISDLAAMGAEPRCFLLSLALPAAQTGKWLDEFLRGLRTAAHKFCCPAAGGDTTRRDQVLINMTVVGQCRAGRAILRDTAKPDDAIFVSGRLGEADYGLRLLRHSKQRINPRDPYLRKHLFPEPRLALGSWLASRSLATAMMDVSDGLSSDLSRLCRASRTGARIEAGRLPIVRVSRKDATSLDRLALAMNGGDDYELLFTVAHENVRKIPRRIAGVPITLIGQISRETSISLVKANGEATPIASSGWDPFRK